MHQIHARHIGQSPWGWRDALVVRVEGLFLTLRYLAEDVEFTAWHHAELPLMPGDPVRVNQSHSAVLQASSARSTSRTIPRCRRYPNRSIRSCGPPSRRRGWSTSRPAVAFNVNNEFQHGSA